MNDDIFHRNLKIDELNRKRQLFSNDLYNIKRYKYKLNEILKEDRKDKYRVEFGLKELICTLLQMHHMKREAQSDGAKLNGVNDRRLID